ncbi:MAG: NlpC/P60 family protein [Flavobacteriales bacterium]
MKKQNTLSIVPMRSEANDRAEMVNQVLFGETFQILESQEKWSLVELSHDHYKGWVCNKQISQATFEPNLCLVDSSPIQVPFQNKSIIISPGSFLPPEHPQSNSSNRSITELARGFLGTPYLWGGRSIFGIDCSGLMQILFRMCGKNIPRDASEQALIGNDVLLIEEAQTGDLAFFDNAEGRIIHVGLVERQIDQLKIYHASGEVRCDILDHQGIFQQESGKYSHNLRIIKRIQY